MKLINLTPHEITMYNDNGEVIARYPSEGIARAETEEYTIDVLSNGAHIKRVRYGNLTGVPEPEDDTYYIVSVIAQQACPERNDLVSPDTGRNCVRDAEGRILGVKGFVRV